MQVKDIDDIVIWAMCPYCEEEVELYSVREQPCPRCGLHFRPSEEEIQESLNYWIDEAFLMNLRK